MTSTLFHATLPPPHLPGSDQKGINYCEHVSKDDGEPIRNLGPR